MFEKHIDYGCSKVKIRPKFTWFYSNAPYRGILLSLALNNTILQIRKKKPRILFKNLSAPNAKEKFRKKNYFYHKNYSEG